MNVALSYLMTESKRYCNSYQSLFLFYVNRSDFSKLDGLIYSTSIFKIMSRFSGNAKFKTFVITSISFSSVLLRSLSPWHAAGCSKLDVLLAIAELGILLTPNLLEWNLQKPRLILWIRLHLLTREFFAIYETFLLLRRVS